MRAIIWKNLTITFKIPQKGQEIFHNCNFLKKTGKKIRNYLDKIENFVRFRTEILKI